MKTLQLGLLFITALTTLLIMVYVREILADFLTFFINAYLNMAGTTGGTSVWIVA